MFGLAPLPRSLGAALRDIESPRPEVRLSAIRDLVRHARSGEAAARQALGKALADASPKVRAGAALGHADADVSAHIEQLSELAARDAAVEVRQMALLALGELGAADPARAVAALSAARGASDPQERFQALLGLHQLGADEAEAAIVAGSADADAEIRRLSFRIAEAHWPEVDEVPEVMRARARAALSDDHPSVRTAAALFLGHVRDPSGKDVLLAILERRAPGATLEDHQAAMALAGELGLREAMPALTRRAFPRLLRDPLSYDARIALARLGDDRARVEILRGLSAWTFDARTVAVAAVGRARLVEARAELERLLGEPERVDPTAVREALAELDRREGR